MMMFRASLGSMFGWAAFTVAALGCDADGSSTSGGGGAGAGAVDGGGGAGGSSSCQENALFGRPDEHTGLGADVCAPVCNGCSEDGSRWEEAPWTEARVAALGDYVLEEPIAEILNDPYQAPPDPVPEGSVCGVVISDAAAKTYRLETFASEADALAAEATVTHGGGCGACSSLEDLAVYARELDLTTPVRACGVSSGGDLATNIDCLKDLGFSTPCAQIWAYNTLHTREQCFDICVSLLGAPYHEPDGSLNACLQCDEDKSGPVFKAVAGRTRRNTGIASALCRPCGEVLRLSHDYP